MGIGSSKEYLSTSEGIKRVDNFIWAKSESISLFPKTATFLWPKRLDAMVQLRKDMQFAVKIADWDTEVLCSQIQNIVDKRNDSCDTMWVWSTIKMNYPEFYQNMINIWVAFHNFENNNISVQSSVSDTLNKS